MTIRIVRVVPYVEGGYRLYTENGEINEVINADSFLQEAVGSRQLGCYFRAERDVDGWHFKSRWRGRPLYW